ncbi:SIS domain-containing protein [Egibacter rhizosphaerae]|uniref:SIS domain-containing protein n=2 Tax=Egibacter rhizosphaerae TaxID=1670831 RepID=A0A411YL81_9ACTN|nr:SIS domain-containing protein [Egibacter rhizosphaerae]
MHAEMAEQPDVLAQLADRRADRAAAIAAARPEPLHGIVLVARGSSDQAAIYGRYALEAAVGRPVALAAPSLHTLYGSEADYRGYLAVATSQSGRTPEIVSVLGAMREAGATTVAITNAGEAPLADEADVLIDLRAGEERAVPATKTFTAQVAAFALVAEALGTVPWTGRDWERLPAAVASVLADDLPAREAAEGLVDAAGIVSVGRGYLYAIALEAALKLKETTSILAQGYSAADLRHGPIAVIERDFPVLAFDAPGPAAEDMSALRAELAERGARMLRVGVGAGQLPVPEGLAEPFVAIPGVVRAQQLARELALARGLEPDAPVGLRKVTPTS